MEPRDASHPHEQRRREILEDHHQLNTLLRSIEEPGAAPSPALTDRLIDLRRVLARHFGREEGADGLFEIIVQRAPEQRAAVVALAAEHRRLLAVLGDAVARCGAPAAGLPRPVVDFLRALREHERRESRLLIEALSVEQDLP